MKKIWKKILAGSLAVVCAVTAGVTAIATNGFGLFNNAAQVEGVDHNNQLSFGNFFGNGITLTASADTPVRSSTVSDCGDVSALGIVNFASAPFGYRDLTLYENSTITKVGVPVLSVSDYTSENIFTLYVVSYDEPLTTFTQVSEYKLKIPANTFTSNTVNAWHYFDVNVTVGDNQTLAFGSTVDTVTWGYGASRNDSQRIFYTKTLGSSYTLANEANCLYFDVYTSDSSTPSVPTGAQRLTAIVTPANAYISGIDWSLAFANPSSTWASGKTVTDYVTVTPTADGAVTADVECKQAFGEQIIITAKSKDNEELTAQCTLDYSKRFQGINATLMCTRVTTGVVVPMINTYVFGKGGVTSINVTKPSGLATYSNVLETNYTWGTGTIEETVSESFTLDISDGLRAAMVAQGLNVNFEPIPIDENTGLLFDTKNLETFFGIAPNSSNYGLLTNAFANNTSDFDFVINYKISTAHHSQMLQSKVKINPDSLIEVTGLVLSLTNHIF